MKKLLIFCPGWLKKPIKSIFHSICDSILHIKIKLKVRKLRARYNDIIFMVATPEHGNLGDQAIVYAELQLLKNIELAHKVVEIPCQFYCRNKNFVKKQIKNKDTIIIDGGGNLGTLWPWEDDKITGIIDTYYQNKIIIFPQTCFYDSTDGAQQRLASNNSVYSKAKNLTISLRDRQSYDYCKYNFSRNVHLLLVPDIVLYLNDVCREDKISRDGILLCLRRDLEKILTDKEAETLRQQIVEKKISYRETSTLIERRVNRSSRKGELIGKWKEFASSKLIITDRLHAMIFAIITNTPCLAIDNLSKKVSGVYNILEDINNVKICSDINQIINLIDQYYYTPQIIKNRNPIDYKELITRIK